MINLKEDAKFNPSYWYTQIKLNNLLSYLYNFHLSISSDNLYLGETPLQKTDFGYETNPHITVLYGITDNNILDKIFPYLDSLNSFWIELGPISKFSSDKYDVIKIEIISPELEKIHYELEELLDNENTFPEYIPHFTIAYVKPGKGDRLIGKHRFIGKRIFVDNLIVTSPDKKDYRFYLV